MGKEDKKKPILCEDEYFILDALKYTGAKRNDAVGILLFLNQDNEKKLEHAKKLRKYIEIKGKYITQQNILSKSFQITTPREQYYPCEMYVKYKGQNTEQLTNNKIYHVEMVFGDDEIYLIKCDDNHFWEFNAEFFEIQKVSEFIYTGSKNEDGTSRLSRGFVVGEKYEVTSLKMGKYTCSNGLECMLDEVEPIGFQPKEPPQPIPFEGIDDALKSLIRALEFGQIRQLSIHIHPECEYISQTAKKEFHTKTEIIKHLQDVAATQLEREIFIDCALATITKSAATNKFSIDDRCFAIYEEDGCTDVAFVTLSDDNKYITGIYILNEVYSFKFD